MGLAPPLVPSPEVPAAAAVRLLDGPIVNAPAGGFLSLPAILLDLLLGHLGPDHDTGPIG